MIIKSDVDYCKQKLQSMIGRRVRLTTNGGRKRLIVHEGIISNCYANVFSVRCFRLDSDSYETITYSYVDILTRNVRIAVQQEASEEVAS